MEKWNERLKLSRLSKNLTQQQVADLAEITRGCYTHYESGIREPSIALIKRFCEILEISADYLIGLTDNY